MMLLSGDSFLIAAGSGVATMGTPDSPGVTKGIAADTLTAPYNNLNAVEDLIIKNKDQGITFEEYCRRRGIKL